MELRGLTAYLEGGKSGGGGGGGGSEGGGSSAVLPATASPPEATPIDEAGWERLMLPMLAAADSPAHLLHRIDAALHLSYDPGVKVKLIY